MPDPAVDFSSIGGKPVAPPPVPTGSPAPIPTGSPSPQAAKIDFSSVGGKAVAPAAAQSSGVPAEAAIPEERRGAVAQVRDMATGLISMPGHVVHAFNGVPETDKEQAFVQHTYGEHGLAPTLGLGIYRLIVAPMEREHQLAKAYETIANQGQDPVANAANADPKEFAKQQIKDRLKSLPSMLAGPVFAGPGEMDARTMSYVHHLSSIIPLLGPMAGDVMEHYKQGDPTGAGTEILSNIIAGQAIEGVTGKLAKSVKRIAPKTATVAGETTPIMAGQEKGAAAIAKKVATEPSPAIADAQQAAAQRGVENVASEALNKQLDKVGANEPRYAYRSRNQGEQGVPNQSHSQAGISEDEVRSYMEHREGIEGQPQQLVRVNLDKLKPEDFQIMPREGKQPWVKFNRPLQESEVEASGADSQFKAAEPRPPAKAESFGDAATQTKAAAQPTFKKLDQVSDNAFSTLQNKIKMARAASRRATSVEGMEAAEAQLKEAQDGVQSLIKQHADQFRPNELENAQSAWKDMQVLDSVHGYVEKAFSAPKAVATKSNLVSRTLDGNKLTANLNSMVDKVPAADLERVLGPDGLTNLYEIGKLASKPETTASVQTMVGEITNRVLKGGRGAAVGAAVAGPKGAAVGATADAAASSVTRAIATKPRVADLMLKALRAGTPAKLYGPLIANEIQKNQDQDETLTADQR